MATGVTQDAQTTGVSTPATNPTVAQQGFNLVGTRTGIESSLSNWAGPYVTEMLGRGMALASQPYEAYTGPLTAGPSQLQQQAFQGLAGLAIPTEQMGTFTPQSFTDEGVAQSYMNPYIQQALQPQLDELRRQTDMARVEQAGRLSRAGAYGGGRQAVMDSELDRAYLDKAAQVTGQGYVDAFNRAAQQFNTEENRRQSAQELANLYGLSTLGRQADLGAQQRRIEGEGVAADIKQFEQELAFPYKQNTYLASLLQNLPLKSQDYTYAEPSLLTQTLAGAGGVSGLYNQLFGGGGGGSGSSGGIGGLLSSSGLGGIVSDVVSGAGDYIGDLFGGDFFSGGGGGTPSDEFEFFE